MTSNTRLECIKKNTKLSERSVPTKNVSFFTFPCSLIYWVQLPCLLLSSYTCHSIYTTRKTVEENDVPRSFYKTFESVLIFRFRSTIVSPYLTQVRDFYRRLLWRKSWLHLQCVPVSCQQLSFLEKSHNYKSNEHLISEDIYQLTQSRFCLTSFSPITLLYYWISKRLSSSL